MPAEDSGFNEGEGTPDSPFLICTYQQLKLISADLSAHYKLGGDIDASTENWTPIGGDGLPPSPSPFTGSLDGEGYVISGLTVDVMGTTGHQYGGLFGYTASAKISNLGLTDVNIAVTSTGNNSYGGGLVGYSQSGTISNSYAVGTVSSASTSTGSNSYGGGLVGVNEGTISNSYAAGTVTSASASFSRAGGLAGVNEGTISSSYAAGSVFSSASSGSSIGGGLVGLNNNSRGIVSNSFATGDVDCIMGETCSSPIFGGLVGYLAEGTISDSYWDKSMEGTGQDDACGGIFTGLTCPAASFGLTTAQMQDGSSASTLGDGFQLTDGEYPKVKKCTTCTGTLEYSDELVPGQE